jgi:hypothetical protein
MKPWKAVLLILIALAVATAGYGLILVRRGFSALATPSAIEEFAATTARKMAVPSAYRQLRNPIMPSTENIRAGMEHFADHCATCHSNDGGGQTLFGPLSETARHACSRDAEQERWRTLLHNCKWSSFERHASLQRSAQCPASMASGSVHQALASDHPRGTQ